MGKKPKHTQAYLIRQWAWERFLTEKINQLSMSEHIWQRLKIRSDVTAQILTADQLKKLIAEGTPKRYYRDKNNEEIFIRTAIGLVFIINVANARVVTAIRDTRWFLKKKGGKEFAKLFKRTKKISARDSEKYKKLSSPWIDLNTVPDNYKFIEYFAQEFEDRIRIIFINQEKKPYHNT